MYYFKRLGFGEGLGAQQWLLLLSDFPFIFSPFPLDIPEGKLNLPRPHLLTYKQNIRKEETPCLVSREENMFICVKIFLKTENGLLGNHFVHRKENTRSKENIEKRLSENERNRRSFVFRRRIRWNQAGRIKELRRATQSRGWYLSHTFMLLHDKCRLQLEIRWDGRIKPNIEDKRTATGLVKMNRSTLMRTALNVCLKLKWDFDLPDWNCFVFGYGIN